MSWWVVDDAVGGPLDAALAIFVPQWLADAWPFTNPRLIGRDLSWDQWRALSENDDV